MTIPDEVGLAIFDLIILEYEAIERGDRDLAARAVKLLEEMLKQLEEAGA